VQPNKVLVTKTYVSGRPCSGPETVEVSCYYISPNGTCTVTGARCPHVNPVSSLVD
jgi:hypothetical protein